MEMSGGQPVPKHSCHDPGTNGQPHSPKNKMKMKTIIGGHGD